MTESNARRMLPIYATEGDPVKIYTPRQKAKTQVKNQATTKRTMRPSLERFKKRYGIALVLAAAFTIYTIILSACVEARTEKRVWAEAKTEYAAQLEEYKAEQAYEAQKEHWLSGEASREAFINQEIEYGAKLIAKETTDQVKGTKLGVALARVMNPNYPGTIQEVAEQPNQWMFYSRDNKVTTHDLEIAEKILRPYYEEGIVPNGLTSEMVYFEWSGDKGTARDSFETKTSMSTWRYQG